MQAADILMKPFTSSEKWTFALLEKKSPHRSGKPPAPTEPRQAAAAADCSRGLRASPKPNRLLVEACCHEESKLSEAREESEGCQVLQFTEWNDLLDATIRREIARQVNEFEGDVLFG